MTETLDAASLRYRLRTVLMKYTVETALYLERIEGLHIRLHPNDWDSVLRDDGDWGIGVNIGDDGTVTFMGIRVVTNENVPQGKPRLVSHMEFDL